MIAEKPRSQSPPEGSKAAVETENLLVKYGRKRAVDGLNLHVPTGSVYGFLGPNGAGKTTTIKTLLGFRRPNGGSARVLGCDVVRQSRKVRAKVGFAGEVSSLYEGMTVGRNIRLCRSLSQDWNERLVARYLETFRLEKRKKVGKLSRGRKAQLQLLLALGAEPELLVLDEPTSGLDPAARRALLKVLVGEVAAGGKTVFFSTHLLSDIEAAADRVGIIKGGKLLASGETDELRRRHRTFRVVYAEAPSKEELEGLRKMPGVLGAKREGRGVKLRVRGDVDRVERELICGPRAVRELQSHGLSLEEIFLGYVEGGDDR